MNPRYSSVSKRLSTANGLFIALIPLAFILEFATHALGEWLDRTYPEQWDGYQFLMFMAIFIIVAYLWLLLIAPRINRLSSAQAIELAPADYPEINYLITGYSPLTDKNHQPLGAEQIRAACVAFQENCADIACACHPNMAGTARLPWQQNLRVINNANIRGGLKTVYVVEPATSQTDHFAEFVRHYFPEIEVKLVTAPHDTNVAYSKRSIGADVRDYENFDYVTGAFRRALQMAAEAEHKEVVDVETRVAIDVTPGVKIFSVAAAIQSLNAGMVFFYAKTHPDSGKVIAYDASVNITASPT